MRISVEQKGMFVSLMVCSALLLFIAGAAPPAHAGTITDDLKVVVDRLVNVLIDKNYAAPGKKQERNKLIHSIINEKFDWEEMARRSIGVKWRDLTPQQQKEFIEVFVDFLERTYISKIDLFLEKSTDFTTKNIAFYKETIEGRYALVESRIAVNEQEIPLHYKLLEKKGTWVVYDLTVEGIGLVANYRTQFNEILAGSSFDDLIKKLKSKEGTDLTDRKAGQGADNPARQNK